MRMQNSSDALGGQQRIPSLCSNRIWELLVNCGQHIRSSIQVPAAFQRQMSQDLSPENLLNGFAQPMRGHPSPISDNVLDGDGECLELATLVQATYLHA